MGELEGAVLCNHLELDKDGMWGVADVEADEYDDMELEEVADCGEVADMGGRWATFV